MFRPVAMLFAILLALYFLVHSCISSAPKEESHKPAPLPPLMDVDIRERTPNPQIPTSLVTNPSVTVGTDGADPSVPITLRIANSYANGGGFNWDRGSGTPNEIRFKGERILSKGNNGTYCCGFTFAVVMRAAEEAGLLKSKTVAQVRQFQRDWYAATPQAKERQQIYALEKHGLGKQVKLMDAQPGDFVRLWHGGSGHSVVFVKWVIENGKKVALEYRGTQGSTNGIGNKTEYLPDPAQNRRGDFDLKRTYVGRLNTPVVSIPTPQTTESQLYAALRKVARYRTFVKSVPTPAYVVEEQNDRHFVAELGENYDTHFVRCFTLRVWKSGRVDELEPLDGSWVPIISR